MRLNARPPASGPAKKGAKDLTHGAVGLIPATVSGDKLGELPEKRVAKQHATCQGIRVPGRQLRQFRVQLQQNGSATFTGYRAIGVTHLADRLLAPADEHIGVNRSSGALGQVR